MSIPYIDPNSLSSKHYVEEGNPKGEPLLLVHGFPDLWYGWRHQIKFLAKQGYRVIALDNLGYGQTDAPMELHKYGLKNCCLILAKLLDFLEIPKVTIIGHDWGGAVVWRFGLYYPNRLHGIISICTPYAQPFKKYFSLEDIVKVIPEFDYQLTFADPAYLADVEQNLDGFLEGVFAAANAGEKEMEYMIEQFKIHGLRGPLNYYKTTKINFEDEVGLTNMINLPCWVIRATHDPFLKPSRANKMIDFIPKLKITEIEAGHFVMTEKPGEVNETLKQCLEDLKLRRSKANL
ncbi:hypothetical protein BGZ76_000189 [Entomortierella beljakovae]|nr:hypothetical protein BGZ76_000189 [Entomortierella beljakovae]